MGQMWVPAQHMDGQPVMPQSSPLSLRVLWSVFSPSPPLFLPPGEARGLFSSFCSGGRRTDNEGGKLVAAFDSGFLLPALACVPQSDTSAGT